MAEPQLRRRQLFAIGGRLIAASAMGAGLNSIVFPGDAQAVDWRNLFQSGAVGGFGKVKELQGTAFINRKPAAVGSLAESGDQVLCTKGSTVILSLSDQSVLRISGESIFTMRLDAKKGGILQMALGSLLAVIPTGNRYLLMGPTATIGVKGTVFYRQAFGPGDTHGMMGDGRQMRLPPRTKEFFCTCNGTVDYLKKDLSQGFEDTGHHHSPYFLSVEDPLNPYRPKRWINHTDGDIRKLIDRQEGPKHDASWLSG